MNDNIIKHWFKKLLHKHNIVIASFDKKDTKEQNFSCHVRLDKALVRQTLFGVRLGLFGQQKNSFNFWLDETEDGKIDLRYNICDNGFKVKDSMNNGYEEFIKEGDIIQLSINLCRDKNLFTVDLYVRHPVREDNRKIVPFKGYSSTGFQYTMKANPKYAIARMTNNKIAHIADADGINYTKEK